MSNEKITLSLNEKQVLIGMCSLPYSSDSEIAEVVNAKRSTFGNIKRRLLDEFQVVQPLNVPNFQALGAELFMFGLTVMNPNKIFSLDRQEILNRLNAFPNIIYSASDLNVGFAYVISKSFTDLSIAHNSIASYYLEEDLTYPEDVHRSIIPLEKPHGIIRFLEFGRILQKAWNISIHTPSELPPISSPRKETTLQISSLGWEILQNLLKNPHYSVNEQSNALNRSRNTISRWIRKFTGIQLFHPRFIPNFLSLGFNLRVIGSFSLEGLKQTQQLEFLELVDSFLLPDSLFLSFREIVFSSIFPDYTAFRSRENQFLTALNERDLPLIVRYKFEITLDRLIVAKDFSFSSLIDYLRKPKE
jgi:DNA-binding Lrp family transcriptional regulator